MRRPARPPRLWLKCGLCGRCPNLAAVTPAPAGTGWPAGAPVPPRLAKAGPLPGPPLPGPEIVLRERPGVTCVIRPGRQGEGFTYLITCPACRRPHQIRHERVTGWWHDFAAARRDNDVIFLGRDM
jgi:hypothetical protein